MCYVVVRGDWFENMKNNDDNKHHLSNCMTHR